MRRRFAAGQTGAATQRDRDGRRLQRLALAQQAGLADSVLAGEDERAAAAERGVVETRLDEGELAFATDEMR